MASSRWNTRKFKKTVATKFCNILNDVSRDDLILIIQPSLLPFVNGLLTFKELTETTTVRKIVLLDDQLKNDLSDILSTMPNFGLVFLIDVRVDLTLPQTLTPTVQKMERDVIDIIYCTWDTQITNNLSRIPHFIQSGLNCDREIKLHPWNMLPLPQFDDDVLLANILYSGDDENLYNPYEQLMEPATRNILLDNMVCCTESLLRETSTYITKSVAIGNYSTRFVELLRSRIQSNEDQMDKLIRETLSKDGSNVNMETDLIVIERDIDPLTPLLSQLTYIGILDDLFKFDPSGKLTGREEVSLDHINDDVWNELKYLNFGAVGPNLVSMAKDLQVKYDARNSAGTVDEIKEFVDSLALLQERQKLLKLHTTLSSDVLQKVETDYTLQFNELLELEQDILANNLSPTIATEKILDLVYEGTVTYERILRLACLLSVCHISLRDKDFDNLKKGLVDNYGVEVCFELERLTRRGLLTSKTMQQKLDRGDGDSPTSLRLRREYKYVSSWVHTMGSSDEEPSATSTSKTSHPRDITFAYCGVAPLSIRYIQFLYDRSILSRTYSSQQTFIKSREPSCANMQELFEKIYGNVENVICEHRWSREVPSPAKPVDVAGGEREKCVKTKRSSTGGGNADVCIVVFLGGVTAGEIATLKFLQQRLRERGINKRFLLVADGLINGDAAVRPRSRLLCG